MKVCYRYIGVRVPGTTIPIECFFVSKRIPVALRERTLNSLLTGLQRGYLRG